LQKNAEDWAAHRPPSGCFSVLAYLWRRPPSVGCSPKGAAADQGEGAAAAECHRGRPSKYHSTPRRSMAMAKSDAQFFFLGPRGAKALKSEGHSSATRKARVKRNKEEVEKRGTKTHRKGGESEKEPEGGGMGDGTASNAWAADHCRPVSTSCTIRWFAKGNQTTSSRPSHRLEKEVLAPAIGEN